MIKGRRKGTEHIMQEEHEMTKREVDFTSHLPPLPFSLSKENISHNRIKIAFCCMNTSGQIGGGGGKSVPLIHFWDFEEPIDQLGGIGCRTLYSVTFFQKDFEEFYFPGGLFKEPPQMTR